MNELNKHKKSDKIKWTFTGIAFVLVFVMLAGVCLQVFGKDKWKPTEWFEKTDMEQPTPEIPDEKNDVNAEANSINYMSLQMSNEAVVEVSETGVKTVSKTLTATVMPLDAPDKSVDWSIEWLVPPTDGADIAEYLSVTPENDGSLTATIIAYKGFENAIAVVTATTRVGKYSAMCQIKYDGAPESLLFIYNGEEISKSGSVTLTAGTTNAISLNLNNTLGAVGSKYGDFEIVKIQGQGRFTLEKQYVVNGSVKSSENIVFDLAEGSYTYTDEVLDSTQTLTLSPDQFLTASVSDNVLTVNAIKSVFSYCSTFPRTGYYFKYKGTYTDPRADGVADVCRWYILVRDKISEVQSLFYVNIESAVNSIALSDNVITF